QKDRERNQPRVRFEKSYARRQVVSDEARNFVACKRKKSWQHAFDWVERREDVVQVDLHSVSGVSHSGGKSVLEEGWQQQSCRNYGSHNEPKERRELSPPQLEIQRQRRVWN